jgi:hypothetical protein
MTGFYVRIEREGKFQPVEIDQMTDAELSKFFESQERDNPPSSRAWAIALAKWIRDNVAESP